MTWAGPSRAVGPRELALYVALMLALASARVALVGGPQFFNDSYQYLSIAENLRERGAIETSIVHFDEERARGRLPAPETTFPPGYSLLIWAFSWTHLAPEWIGLLISLAATIGVLALLRSGARALNLTPNATRACLLFWTFSAQALLYGVTLYAEAVFTFLALAAVVLLLEDAAAARVAAWRLPAAFLLAGASFWLRYAGLFLVAALHLYAIVRVVRERRRFAAWIVALIACDVVVAFLMARNVAIAGVWTGGNSRPIHHSVALVLHRLGVAAYELAFGSIQDPRSLPFGIFALLLFAGALGLLASFVRGWLRSASMRGAAPGQSMLLFSCVVLYCGGMTYAGFTSQISLSARMFVPLLPVLALLAGLVFSRVPTWSPPFWTRPTRTFAGLLAAGYIGSNVEATLGPQRIAEHRTVTAALALPMQDGESLLAWFGRSVPRDGVLLSVEGQATGYVLRLRTISAVGRTFTTATWDEDEVRRTIAKFGVTHVIVYRDVVDSGGIDGLDSKLFRALASKCPPAWLELAAENPRVVVYHTRF